MSYFFFSQTLANIVTEADLDVGRLYPPLTEIQNVSVIIAKKIMEDAYEKGMFYNYLCVIVVLACWYPIQIDRSHFCSYITLYSKISIQIIGWLFRACFYNYLWQKQKSFLLRKRNVDFSWIFSNAQLLDGFKFKNWPLTS